MPYDWNNNPRIEIERRIKQLDGREWFLLQFIARGGIEYEDGVAVRFFPSTIPRVKRDKAGRLLKIVQKEIRLKWHQLKSF